MLRCAIYARYSTDKQNPLSIDDQVRKCREFAQRQGWDVLDGRIYCDEAITGASDERTGLQRLLDAATSSSHPFDAILVDDTSRLSRKLADSLRIFVVCPVRSNRLLPRFPAERDIQVFHRAGSGADCRDRQLRQILSQCRN